jgi:RHS repeat-associated protein
MGVVGLSGTTATTGTATPVGYAGAYAEPGTGLIYLINRYYDPATAQFLSVDPAVALTQQPYSYAGDDPVNEVDPTGLAGGMPLQGECAGQGGRWVSTSVGQGNCVGKVTPHSVVAEAGNAFVAGAKTLFEHPLQSAAILGGATAIVVGTAVTGGLADALAATATELIEEGGVEGGLEAIDLAIHAPFILAPGVTIGTFGVGAIALAIYSLLSSPSTYHSNPCK